MKKFTYLMALLAFTACSNDEESSTTIVEDRTPITFSASSGAEVTTSPMTKALTTPTESGFTEQTRILMRIKSKDGLSSPSSDKYTRTVAKAAASTAANSGVSFDNNDMRYWDDAHGRSSQLSVYAVAIENVSDAANLPVNKLKGSSTSTIWFAESPENETIQWSVTQTQDNTSLINDNLVYSNNISSGGSGGVEMANGSIVNGVLQFEPDGAGHGKFNKGHMKFNHALTKITVKLTKGTGFTTDFSSVSAVVVQANQSGTLDLTNGTWGSITTKNVTMASVTDKSEYSALILPGMTIASGNNTNILELTIDGNVYYITSEMIYDGIDAENRTEALSASGVMLQGKHYVVNAKINKTGINAVSASVIGWADVAVEDVKPSNAYISLQLFDASTGTNTCSSFDLYRLKQETTNPSLNDPGNLMAWSGAYTDKAVLTPNGDKFTTQWFFESNKIFYHFRTVNKNELVTTTSPSSFTIKSGFKDASVDNPLDPHWGAPMKSGSAPSYNPEHGFEGCIHSAIGTTTDDIKITEFHMLSYIYVQLKSESPTSNSNEQVNLTNAKVKFLQLGNEATVDMGSGKIATPSSVTGNTELKLTNEANKFFSPIVPQSLNRGNAATDKVGIEIETMDGNIYKVNDISQYAQSGSTTIVERWLPGYKYHYTFNLLKTGINTITCTITDWQNVVVTEDNVTIE